ncbi:hypothetical protein [Petrocella sp. FN5]|uniref:hypothetical protein n=1 Tax=Petrocella sp. FN5 TaxID=3032002 RepID=UPI0023DA68EE|nr:hypothetical protein [Petrocella sp. FN5]MDF1616267.1 hypothetical protein [Petrocella sp. FN5]
MPWCPKCKTEYEDHIAQCVDCNIDLVPDLENHTYMRDLIAVKPDDSEELLRYLTYSGIEKVETVQVEDNLVIKVGEKEYESAMTYVKVYIREHMEETKEDDFYFDEYEAETVDVKGKVSEMKSTVYTFGIVGILAIILGLLNYMEVIKIGGFNKIMISSVLVIMGGIFTYIAVHTRKGIDVAKAEGETKEQLHHQLVANYFNTKSEEGLFGLSGIKEEDFDDPAMYFAIIDKIKVQVKNQNPDAPPALINGACETIYDQINENRESK